MPGPSSFRIAGVALWAALSACGGPAVTPVSDEALAPSLYENDVHVPRGFVPRSSFRPAGSRIAQVRQGVSVEGDIVVINGDARVVSAEAPQRFGLTADNQRAILSDVLGVVPDRFDTFVIFTSFEDNAPMDRWYYQSLRNTVSGIGLMLRNQRTDFGLPAEGRLSGYVGMNSPLVWGGGSLDGLNAAQGDFHAAIARALARRWAMYLRFLAPNGMPSSALLGPADGAWSALGQANGSLLGGNDWERTAELPDAMGFANYVNRGRNQGFAPLDLYAMGRRRADEVPVLFYLSPASQMGMPVDAGSDLPMGAEVRGRPNIVNVQQVVDAMGPRQPPVSIEDPYYRVAFVFITEPGSTRDDWGAQLTLLESVRQALPASWKAWGAGNLCTQIQTPCPEPQIGLDAPILEDDGDGLVAPGEQLGLRLVLRNTGIGTASGVQVELRSTSNTLTVAGGPFTAPDIEQNGTVSLDQPFMLTVSSTVACGTAITLRAEMTTQEGPMFTESIVLSVGTRVLREDPLEEAPDWRIDPEGTDSASGGVWALGDPDLISVAGIVTQPDEDNSPGEGKLAFVTGPPLGGFFATNDLDGGRTTVQSPVFAIGSASDPFLVFWAWRTAYDFTVDPPTSSDQAPIVVEVSNDGGSTWQELGRFDEQTTAWTRVELRIRDVVEPTDRMRFRFWIEERDNANIEAGIDDLEIVDFLASCNAVDPGPGPGPGPGPSPGPGPGDGEGSSVGDEGGCRGAGGPPGALALGWVLILLVRRRSRRV